MSKLLSIAAAVTAELSSPPNPKWPPNNLNKVMGADYNFNEHTLALFFRGVSDRLRAGTPVWLDAASQHGVVRNELSADPGPRKGERAVELHARTGYGDITLHRAVHAAARTG